MIGIYKITSPSGRVYIGQSVNIEKRFNWYRGMYCKAQVKLYNSFVKYGVDNHAFEVITECERRQLNDLERYYQEIYNTLKHGLNCTYTTAENAPGERSEETKRKISVWNKGRKRPLHERLKLSEGRKGMKFSPSHCENIRLSKTGANNKCSKLVIDLSSGIYFDCIQAAANAYNLDSRTLSKYLLGQRRNKTNLSYA